MSSPHPESVLGLRERLRAKVEPLLDEGDELQVLVPASTVRRGAYTDLRNPTPASVKSRRCLLIATHYAWISAEVWTTAREPVLMATGHSSREIEPVADGLTPVQGMNRIYYVETMWAEHIRAAGEALAARQAGRAWSLVDCGDWVSAPPPQPAISALSKRLRRGSRSALF